MSKINWSRLVLGAVIAALIAFLTDGFLHERILDTDWRTVYSNLGATPPVHDGGGIVYFAVFELGRGFVSIFLYTMMRSHFGPGPKTAVLAGVIGWLAFSVTGPAQFIPLGFFSNPLWIKLMGLHLITSILATLAGAALYKDPRVSSEHS